jgi:hypothetical protein
VTASEWVTLTISVAGVFVGLVVVATIKYRKPLIIVCVTLVIAALAIAAISTIINLGPSSNSSSSDASSSPTSTPLQGPYVDAEGCFYDVTNDSNAGAEAHQIRDQGRIQQNFTATLPYIRSFSVVIGYEGTRPGKVKLQLRDGDKILRQDSVEIVNNRGTQLRLDPPIRVEIGRTYTL